MSFIRWRGGVSFVGWGYEISCVMCREGGVGVYGFLLCLPKFCRASCDLLLLLLYFKVTGDIWD